MSRKLTVPPRAVFKHRKIKASDFEKPRPGINQEWIAELDAVEARVKNFISLDINRMKTICDTDKDMERLCLALDLKLPLGETGPEFEFSLHNFPAPKSLTKTRKRRALNQETEDAAVEGEEREEFTPSSDSKEDMSIEDDIYRRSLFESVMARASSRKGHVSPYAIALSDEVVDRVERRTLTPPSVTSTEKSVETVGHLSEDLFVIPARSQNTELLEPLEDARSPYQRFFTRTPKEIREHVERLRKKKFRTQSEKAIEDFVKYLDEMNLRSPKITTETVNNLFKVEVETPAEKAFSLEPHELPSVPKEIADLFQDPHSSTRAVLHQQILWDMVYEKGKEQKLAFGRKIPKERRSWNRNTREHWFFPTDVSWDEISGKDLWKDLLHTEILEDFGKWLLDNPKYEKPEYLVSIGFFDYLKEKIAKESEPLIMPVNEEQFVKIVKKLNRPLSLDMDEERFKKLPRYDELKEAALHRVVTQEGLKVFEGTF